MKLLFVLAAVLALGLAAKKVPAAKKDKAIPAPEILESVAPDAMEDDEDGEIEELGAFINGRATCDDELQVFSDGCPVSIDNADNWRQSGTFKLPYTARVVGLRCRNRGFRGGIKAAFDNGVSTDSSWKCSNRFCLGWTRSWFDQSRWDDATEISSIFWGFRPWDLSFDSKWIWTSGLHGRDQRVYCRTEFPPTTYNCRRRNPCTNLTPDDIANHRFYYPNKNEKRFVQCDAHGGCDVKRCTGGTVWDQSILNCNWP